MEKVPGEELIQLNGIKEFQKGKGGLEDYE
jgi:hypothetical protein